MTFPSTRTTLTTARWRWILVVMGLTHLAAAALGGRHATLRAPALAVTTHDPRW